MVRRLLVLTLCCGFVLLPLPASSQDRIGFGYVCSASYNPSYPNSIWGDFGTVGVIKAAPHSLWARRPRRRLSRRYLPALVPRGMHRPGFPSTLSRAQER